MTPLYGLILAGGKSSRMGQVKAALMLHGKPQVRYLADMITPYVERVAVSVRAEQMQDAHLQGFELIADAYDSPSPLNGIVSAMDQFPDAAWLVLAVDMPDITPEAVEKLIMGRNVCYPATSFTSPAKGGADPLFAIWEPDHHQVLKKRLLDAGLEHVCPRKTLAFVGSYTIPNPINHTVLTNLNTPQELAEWKAHHDNR